MPYCTSQDLINALNAADIIRLTDDALTGSASDAVLTAKIKAADAEIDAYLSSRYSLPLAATPDLINNLSAEITIYLLFLRRGAAPAEWQKRYDRAIALLEKIQAGDAALTGPTETSQGTISYDKDEEDKVFTDTKLTNFTD